MDEGRVSKMFLATIAHQMLIKRQALEIIINKIRIY